MADCFCLCIQGKDSRGRTFEPCENCYVWHPYAICFVLFVLSLPIVGFVIGISDIPSECHKDIQGLNMSTWLIVYSASLFCYELYFFGDLPSYWSNMYARMCLEKVRVAFYYVFTLALFLWWCTGWYIFAIDKDCQSTQLGAISLIVLLVSMVEAMIVGCFVLVTLMVRGYIAADHPSNRRDFAQLSRDTDPLLNRQHGWFSADQDTYGGEAGTQSGVGLRGRISAMFQEREAIANLQYQHAQQHHQQQAARRQALRKKSFTGESSETARDVASVSSDFLENPPQSPREPLRPGTPAEPNFNAADGDLEGGI